MNLCVRDVARVLRRGMPAKMPRKWTIVDVIKLAHQKGGEFLSPEYENNRIKYLFGCNKGHSWRMTCARVKAGGWCKECFPVVHLSHRRRPSFLDEVAEKRGVTSLSVAYVGQKFSYFWKCKCGHVFRSHIQQLLGSKACKKCVAISQRTGIDEVVSLAKSKNGVFLSSEYINAHSKYDWGCSSGHVWKTTYNDIQQGGWCPYCKTDVSKVETAIFQFVLGLYPDALSRSIKLLPNKRFELDIFVPSLRKAVEYNGIRWHATVDAQDRDRRKRQECNETGIALLTIDHKNCNTKPRFLKTLEQVKKFLGGNL